MNLLVQLYRILGSKFPQLGGEIIYLLHQQWSYGSLAPDPWLNSLTSGRFKVNFRWVVFKLILVVNGWDIYCETALIWVSLDHTYDKSTLAQVMAWCHQATSHYLSQCWPRSLSPYGVTRPQWVKSHQGWVTHTHIYTVNSLILVAP